MLNSISSRQARTSWRSPLLAALAGALLTACGSTAPSAPGFGPPAVRTGRDPVVFVHGYNSSGAIWSTMTGNFKKDGWTDADLFSWSYDTRQSNAMTADLLRQKVDAVLAQTGAARVDIVTHSMGGLSSRYYLRNLGGDGRVDAWVSLGGPNHSTDAGYLCGDTSCTEMRPGSAFLTNLNSGDETPGASRFGTWWSPCDEVINPDSSVALSGAANTQTACLHHSQLYQDAGVYRQVRDFISK